MNTSYYVLHMYFRHQDFPEAHFSFEDGEWNFSIFGKKKTLQEVLDFIEPTSRKIVFQHLKEKLLGVSAYDTTDVFVKFWVSELFNHWLVRTYDEVEKNTKAKPRRLEEETHKNQIKIFKSDFVGA